MSAARHTASIRFRLMSILLSTSAAVVLVTSAIFGTYEALTFRQSTINHLETLARVVATNVTAALAFDDRTDAAEMLAALRHEPDLSLAVLYDAEGQPFSAFAREGEPVDPPPDLMVREGVHFTAAYLEAYQPVVQGGRRLGTLYLRSELAGMYRRFTLYGTVVVLVVISSLLIAYGLSRILQRSISQPILSLAETARAVSERRDYSVRAPRQADDELGVLTTAFNHMLTQIQERDQALREGAARMRAVLDSALSAVVVVDEEDRIIDWTNRAEQVFGWSRAQAVGRTLAQLVVPSTRWDAYDHLRRRVFASPQGTHFGRPFEATALRKDQTEFPVEVSISPLRTGTHITVCGFVTDITERKRWEHEMRSFAQELEDRVADRTAQLESANRELEAFSYSVSHDLRAPLRHIDGFATMLARHSASSLDAQGQRYLATISEAARNMGRLIDDLLAFSRTGRSALNLVTVDQDALVADIITEGAFDQAERPVEWHVEPLPQVQADAGLLRLVWRNLIGNAVKYSSQAARPEISIGCTSSSAREHVCYIRDNGVGFDMKYAHKLFGVFQRLHTTGEFPGTGIGLAHVKRIISRHGGRVWAQARPGEGATFWFSLPNQPLPENHAPADHSA